MSQPQPTLPEPLWNALSKLTHIVSREDTEPPLNQFCASSSHNPTAFLLLHTAWHLPTCFSRLTSLLRAQGYQTLAPHLPSSGANPPLQTWDLDIEAIRNGVTTLARDHGLDVVVVLHAHAGLAGTQALRGLDKTSCLGRGWRAGIIRLVYIGGHMFPEGWTQLGAGRTASGLDPRVSVDSARGVTFVPAQHVRGLLYQDVDDEAEIAELAAGLVPQSLAPGWCASTYAAWRWMPTTYVVTRGDTEEMVAAQEWIVKSAVENVPNAIDKVVRRDVGHCPFWSQTEWTAALLIEEAERSVEP